MSIPSSFPQYITNIQNLSEKTRWQSEYLQAYEQEYEQLNSQWNGLKVPMSGISIIALTTFATIMTATAPASVPLVVASCIAIGSIGLTAAICSMLFYGCLADANERKMKELPTKFPIKFEVKFHQIKLEEEKVRLGLTSNPYPYYQLPYNPEYVSIRA